MNNIPFESLVSVKNINKQLEELVFSLASKEEIEERLLELKQTIKEDTKKIKIMYGCQYTLIGKFGAKTKYSYKFFVKPVEKKHLIHIKQVDFDINPHIKPARPIKVMVSPYEFERSVSYEYDIEITIYFSNKIKESVYKTSVSMNFNEEITKRMFMVNLK